MAEIYLDYARQVDGVVLYENTSEELQLNVLRLAASHVRQFVKNRTTSIFGGIMSVEHRDRSLTPYDSDRLMDFEAIPPEVQEMDREEIIRGFRTLPVFVVVATYASTMEAVKAAVLKSGIKGLKYKFSLLRTFGDEVALEFSIRKPSAFTFWNCVSLSSDLYIVPDYHPAMKKWKAVGMVNGDTDAYIRGDSIKSLYCPKAAQADTGKQNFGTSWSNVKHPYRAQGQSMTVSVRAAHMRSSAAVEGFAQFLRASLNLDNTYVEISGGFRPPLKCPHNRLLEARRTSPWPGASRGSSGHVARGSEAYCVWAHRVLEEEGALTKAYVPSWFKSEGWLEIYKGAEVRHGLY